MTGFCWSRGDKLVRIDVQPSMKHLIDTNHVTTSSVVQGWKIPILETLSIWLRLDAPHQLGCPPLDPLYQNLISAIERPQIKLAYSRCGLTRVLNTSGRVCSLIFWNDLHISDMI